MWSGPGVVGRKTGSGVLTLSDIWTSQAGQYNCTATHKALFISTTVDITVKCKDIRLQLLYLHLIIREAVLYVSSLPLSSAST